MGWTAASRSEWLVILLWRIGIAAAVLGVWQIASGRLIKPFWISSPLAIGGISSPLGSAQANSGCTLRSR